MVQKTGYRLYNLHSFIYAAPASLLFLYTTVQSLFSAKNQRKRVMPELFITYNNILTEHDRYIMQSNYGKSHKCKN